MEMVERLISRTDAAYQRWLACVADDVVAGGVVIYCLESLVERNATYRVGEWLTGYLLIGQEGDRGFFLRCDGGGPVFWADLGGLGEVDLDVAASGFEVWRRSGFALPADPDPDLPLTADVYVDGIPLDGVQLLSRVRKLLGVDWRFGDLGALLAAQPILAARSAHLYALRRDLEGAHELRPYLLYATDHGLETVWSTGSVVAVSRAGQSCKNLVDGAGARGEEKA
ncbi:hypothetical protein ACIBEF_10140 [Micromonospora sp. NPDC050795]|uniref:hypothetical protein n=1 Tax=Micromonospora sp. NPDC050795 TaxID=3364282 RepID=UPI00379CF7F8